MRQEILKAAVLIAKLRDAPERHHLYRLRVLAKLSQIINDLTAKEAKAANAEALSDPAHLSWDQIGQALEISRSAAFTRYANKEKK